VGTCFELNELVRTPACCCFKRRVVVGCPKSCTCCRSNLGSFVLSLVNYRKAGEVVWSPYGKAAVFLKEGICLI